MFHFAGIGDIVPSIEQPIEYMSTSTCRARCACSNARAHAGVEKFVYAASSSCYGLAATPTREDHPIAPQYPYALSQVSGRAGGVPLAQGLQAAGQLDPHLQCLWHARRAPRAPTARCSACSCARSSRASRSRSSATARRRATFSMSPTSQRRSWPRPRRRSSASVCNLGAGNPQSVNRLVELLGGAVVYIPKRPGEPDCTWADITKISAMLGWKPQVSFEEGVERMLADIELLARRAAVGSGIDRARRPRPGSSISAEEAAVMDDASSLIDRYRHKIKTPEELRAIIGPRAARAAR